MNNDELQKAIDDITKETAPAPAEPVAAETEALANEIAGATAPTTGEGVALAPVAEAAPAAEAPAVDIPAAPAPAVPETPAMPPVAEAPAAGPAPAEPVAPAPAPVVAAEPEVAATGMDDIKKEALKELYPLLDKTDMTAEEKYDICMEMQSEPDAIRNALGYAKQFTDMGKKVDALLKIYRM